MTDSTEYISGSILQLIIETTSVRSMLALFHLLVDRNLNSFQLGPDRNSVTGSGGIRAGSGPVLVDFVSTRPVPRFFCRACF